MKKYINGIFNHLSFIHQFHWHHILQLHFTLISLPTDAYGEEFCPPSTIFFCFIFISLSFCVSAALTTSGIRQPCTQTKPSKQNRFFISFNAIQDYSVHNILLIFSGLLLCCHIQHFLFKIYKTALNIKFIFSSFKWIFNYKLSTKKTWHNFKLNIQRKLKQSFLKTFLRTCKECQWKTNFPPKFLHDLSKHVEMSKVDPLNLHGSSIKKWNLPLNKQNKRFSWAAPFKMIAPFWARLTSRVLEWCSDLIASWALFLEAYVTNAQPLNLTTTKT